jgi:hypothetical protein
MLADEIELNIQPDEYFTELDTQSFDKESGEIFLNFNMSNNTVKTSRFEFNSSGGHKYREVSLHRFEEKICSISGSSLIRGECAALTDSSVFLTSSILTSKVKIVDGIQPLFRVSPNTNWKSIKCSFAQPREYFYSDNTQVLVIDSRYKPILTPLFASSLSLKNNEMIHRTERFENNYNYHVICCEETLAIVDDRYPKRCVLSLKHALKNPCLFLKNIQLDSSEETFIVTSDSREILVNQVSIKTGRQKLVSDNHRVKAHTPNEIRYSLPPDSYDRTLDRCLNARLNESRIVGLSAVNCENSFYLFQVWI